MLPFIQEREDGQPSVPAPTPAITPSPKTTPATPSHEQSPIPSPKGGEYLYFRGGEKTKVFLIESNMRYGTYDGNIFWPEYSVKKGDPCVIINGRIRNDYDKGYFISLTADICNIQGEKVGTVVCPSGPKPFVEVVYAKSNSTKIIYSYFISVLRMLKVKIKKRKNKFFNFFRSRFVYCLFRILVLPLHTHRFLNKSVP